MNERIFHIDAYNLFDSLPIKDARALYPERLIAATPVELAVALTDASFMFVYRFGAVAFYDVPDERRDAELARLRDAFPFALAEPTHERYDVRVGAAQTRVGLDAVDLADAGLKEVALVAMTVSQSAALEYFERRAGVLLNDSAAILERLAVAGEVPLRSKAMLRFIGAAAATRQNILSNLAIVNPPESTWSSRELQNLHRDLQENFDVETRFKALDRKLTLVQDNIEILADLANSRKAVILEILVIVLIVVEIALGIGTRL